jgi:hypothetical protein
MTTQEQKAKAIKFYNQFKNSNRLTKESIQKELDQVNKIVKKELRFSKEFRKIDYLNTYLNSRHYYKQLISLL